MTTVPRNTTYGRAVAKERERLTTLLAGRTNPDGTARKGLIENVVQIRKRLAALPVEDGDDEGVAS